MSSQQRVIVVGGGLAGITAALDCAAAGHAVTLLESRGRLGGQAYSFTREGITADNGQHVFLRCCTEYRALVERIGAGEKVTLQDRLDITVLGPGRRGRLYRSGLPAPLHLAGALLRYPFLGPRERLSAAMAMAALSRVDVEDPVNDRRTFGEWLREHRQGAAATEALWDLITRPTVNLAAAHASLAQAAYVFQEGLLSSAAAGDLGHARVPLSEIHDVAAGAALRRAGVQVRLRAGVAAIEPPGSPSGWADPPRGAVRRRSRARDGARADGAPDPRRRGRRAGVGAGARRLGDRQRPRRLRPPGARRPVRGRGRHAGAVGVRPHAGAGLGDGQYLAVSLSAAERELAMTGERCSSGIVPALAALLPVADAAPRWCDLRHPRPRRHVPCCPGAARAASRRADGAARARARGSPHRHRLAGDDGGRGAQRARGQ